MTSIRARFLVLLLVIGIGPLLATAGSPTKTKDAERIDQLVKQLGNKNFAEREKAAKALIELGEPALDKLESATRSPDLEVSRRAKACIEAIKEAPPVQVPNGVTVIKLPYEVFSLKNVGTKQKPMLRLTYGKVVIEGQRLFLGDGKIAQGIEATSKGMAFLKRSGERGEASVSGEFVFGPGDGKIVIYHGLYLRPDQLKAGSIYIISPAFGFASE